MHPMNVPIKFEVRIALPVPEITGVSNKFRAVSGYVYTPYPPPKKKNPIGLPYTLFLCVHSFTRNFLLEFGWLGVANPQSRVRGL